LPRLNASTLGKVRFRQVASVRQTEAGMCLAYADGKQILVRKGSPLHGLSILNWQALSNSLPQLIDGALKTMTVAAIVTPGGRLSPQFADYAISASPVLQGLLAAGFEVPQINAALTRWLQATRRDYAAEMSFQFMLNLVDNVMEDLRFYISLQLNNWGGGIWWAGEDAEGTPTGYIIDEATGDILDQHMNKVGNIHDQEEDDDDDDKGLFESFWDWLTGDGIMWGKEPLVQLQTYVACHFLDTNLKQIRTLVTEVAAGQRTVAELEVQLNALVELRPLKAAFMQSNAAPAIKQAFESNLSVLRDVHISAMLVP